MLLENKSVAIVGGGPGGLTLARLLQLKGANVKVYERDLNREARVQGSTLDLHKTSGLAALTEANLLTEFRNNYLPGADKTIIVNEQAEICFSDHDLPQHEDFGEEHFRPEIDRGTLRKILLDALQPDTVVWDSHFVSMNKHQDGWLLNFMNKPSVYADVVVAADGANSKLRPYLTDIKPFYTGITMLEGNIYDATKEAPGISKLLNGGKIMAFGKNRNILMGQKGNGEIGFYISFKAGKNWSTESGLNFSDKRELLEWFQQEYHEWSGVWYELFEKGMVPFIPRPIYCMPLDQTWQSQPNLTLIGDAAHVMPPFAGEGVNMAMLDALKLSENLTTGNYRTLQEAIASFETDMRSRASLMAKESLENGERMHSTDALVTMLDFFGAQPLP